ncbi:MarR family winged helix-turn-helix transcriptional regulator [Kitasatospora sp. NPDC101801]|uniref:MarR family winged helix-turn-helix transcriptional regulator n=1 Tax=unclassified Kitasatospora TaxID=2633591 RepID=UPI003248AB10
MTERAADHRTAEQALTAVEREVAVLFRRGRARAAEMSRQVHPALEGVAYSMLGFIQERGQVRLTDIGLHFGVGKATISRQVKVLEELELVARETDPLDRRSSLVSLTPDGEARYLAARSGRLGRFRDMLGSWDSADVAQLADLLQRFNDAIGEPKPS